MNKLWAVIVSLTLVAQICAMVEEVPATFNYQGKNYRLSKGYTPLFLEEGCLKYNTMSGKQMLDNPFMTGILGAPGIVILKAADADYALFEGHEYEVVAAVLCAYKKHPKAVEQLRGCRMFGETIGDTPAYEIFLRDRQRDRFLKTRVIPAVAIAAAVGVAVKYRAALKRMATKAKDRVTAWWHGSDKKMAVSIKQAEEV